MKTRTLKTSVGIVAVAALVGMNLFHAWNNYGIKDSSKLLCINASPAEDSTSVSVDCGTKPFATTHYNAISNDNTYKTHCLKYQEIYYYKTIEKKRVLIAIKYIDYKKDASDIKYTSIKYENINLETCKDTEIKNQKNIIYDGVKTDCEGYSANSCCYATGVLDCTQILKNATD